MGSTELDNKSKVRFNNLYMKATELLKGKVVLNNNYYKPLSDFEKIEIAEAIALYKECIAIYPLSWQSCWAIGKAYQSLEEQDMALEWFERACEIDQHNVNIFRETTLQSLALGLKEKAEKYAQAAINMNPNDDGFYSNYALALLINKKGEAALDAINKALSVNSDDQINKNVHSLIKSVLEGKKAYPEKIGPRG